jgi:hypothetical protein
VVTTAYTKKVFRRFSFRHFNISCDEVFQYSKSRTLIFFTFRHFDIPVVKCFDTPTPGIRNLHQKVFFTFRHFDIPVVKCFDTSNSRYPKLRNGVRSTVRYFRFSHFGILQVGMLSYLLPLTSDFPISTFLRSMVPRPFMIRRS